MGDRSLRGRGILGRAGPKGGGIGKVPKGGGIDTPVHPEPKKSKRRAGPGPRQTRPKMKGPPHIVKGKEDWDALERLGISASGGIEGKPHSTWRGRMSAGKNLLNRFWGQKYTKKKKGTPV